MKGFLYATLMAAFLMPAPEVQARVRCDIYSDSYDTCKLINKLDSRVSMLESTVWCLRNAVKNDTNDYCF